MFTRGIIMLLMTSDNTDIFLSYFFLHTFCKVKPYWTPKASGKPVKRVIATFEKFLNCFPRNWLKLLKEIKIKFTLKNYGRPKFDYHTHPWIKNCWMKSNSHWKTVAEQNWINIHIRGLKENDHLPWESPASLPTGQVPYIDDIHIIWRGTGNGRERQN